MSVTVTGGTGKEETVTVPADVKCSLGGRSVPIVPVLSATPHTDVTVAVIVVPVDPDAAADAVYPSAGLTPDANA